MKIIIKEGLRVYYYKDLKDLELVKEELNAWKINFHFDFEMNSCRICPREQTTVVLLKRSENKELDLKRLNLNLSLFNIEGIEEL